MATGLTLVLGALVIMPLSGTPQEPPREFLRASLKSSLQLAATPHGKSPIQIAIFEFFAGIG
jgi:hypothetical protein